MILFKAFFYLKRYFGQIREHLRKGIILEIHAADQCNLNCSCCSHFSPIAPAKFCDLEILENNLENLKKFSSEFDLVHILGGEPLLFPELTTMVKLVREYLPNNIIKILTNGLLLVRPEKLPQGFWAACKENDIIIQISQYPVNLDHKSIMKLCEENGVKCEIDVPIGHSKHLWHKFELNEKGSDCREFKYRLFKIMKCTKRCFQLVDNKLYACHYPAYIPYLNNKFSTNLQICQKDYIQIDQLRSRWQIKKMHLFGSPFCRYCNLPKYIDWSVSKKEKEEWISPDIKEKNI